MIISAGRDGVGTGECMGRRGYGDAEDGRHREGAVAWAMRADGRTLLPWTTIRGVEYDAIATVDELGRMSVIWNAAEGLEW